MEVKMIGMRTGARPGVQEEGPGSRRHMEKGAPLLFLGMLVMSIIGSYAVEVHWGEIVVNHLGGLGVVGLLACLAAYIAKKKGRDHRRAFWLGILPPVVLGAVTVILVYFLADTVYCGGGVILAAAIAIIIGYACLKKKKKTGHAACGAAAASNGPAT
jgi:hypothetical protein